MADSVPRPPGRRITVRRFANSAEADRHDVEFWRQLSDAERVLQTWRLSQELWRLRGEFSDEPGLTDLTGLRFAEAWSDRVHKPFGDVTVDFIGRDAFIRNKRATGRAKDLGDIEGL